MTELREKWEARAVFFEGEAASLERRWRSLRKLGLLAFVLPWVGLLWSGLVVALIFFGWLGFIASAAWIIGVRLREMRDEAARARREAAALTPPGA